MSVTEYIRLSINVDKIDKTRIVSTEKGGRFLNLQLAIMDSEDRYGSIGIVKHNLTKEEREAGQDSDIIGNVKGRTLVAPKAEPKPQPKPAPAPPADDDLPF